MVLPVDTIAFQIVSVVGLTLPIFIFAVDAFENDDYSDGLVLTSIVLLISAAVLTLAALLAPPQGRGDLMYIVPSNQVAPVIRYLKNLFVDVATVLLAMGYLGLGWSIYDMMGLDIDMVPIDRKGTVLVIFASILVISVVILNIVI